MFVFSTGVSSEFVEGLASLESREIGALRSMSGDLGEVGIDSNEWALWILIYVGSMDNPK